jgi:hypothetical protein
MSWELRHEEFYCTYLFESGSRQRFKALDVMPMHEPIVGNFPAFFVLCPMFYYSSLPQYVKITDKNFKDNGDSSTYVGISYPNKSEQKLLAVCPGPAQNNFNNALRIAEFVEMYKLLGAEKIYFYNMSITENVDKMFVTYESEEIANIQQWNIADVLEMSESIIHYYGIMATLNDCFYRASLIDNFKYVAIADFDEIIFPLDMSLLTDFLDAKFKPSDHSLVFPNFFIFSDFPIDYSNVKNNVVNKYLYSQAQVIRMKYSTGNYKWYRVRTKFVARSDVVTEVGNHYVWSALNGTSEHKISFSDAVMFHYRDECIPGYCEEPTIPDYSARKYGTKLFENVDRICGKVFEDGICPK